MIRVMVMDEDEQVGVNLNKLLQKQSGGGYCMITVCHREAAQRQWKAMSPDIVISETTLPGWQRDELLTEIKNMAKSVPVIMLSDDCGYASMRRWKTAGVWDCLSKSLFDPSDFILTLKEAAQETKRLHQQGLEPLAQQLRALKDGYASGDDFADVIQAAPLSPTLRKGCRIAYFQVDHINAFYASDYRLHQRFQKQLQALIQVGMAGKEYEWLSLYPHAGVLLAGKAMCEEISECFTRIIQEVRETMNLSLSITISDECAALMDFPAVFQNVCQAHELHFYTGLGNIVKTKEAVVLAPNKAAAMDYHSRMWEALKIRDFKELLRIHQEFIAAVRSDPLPLHELFEYVTFILHNMEGNERTKGMKAFFPFDEMIVSLRGCEDIDELDQMLRNGYERMGLWFQEESDNRYGKDIVEIINYVEANYTQKITLGKLAEVFGMNESYLSRMFKNQTGKNLIYFINEKKMNKARELLKDPDMMVKEAAFAVGYDDQFYFNKLFRRFFGVSPTEYRRRFTQEKG